MIKKLSYISKINKTQKEIKILLQELMRTVKLIVIRKMMKK